MKELNLNKNSLHFKIAAMVGYIPRTKHVDRSGDEDYCGNNPDICTYINFVFRGIIVLLLCGIVIAFFGHILAHMFLGIIYSFIMGEWFFTDMGEAAIIIFGSISAGVCIFFGTKKYTEWSYNRRIEKRKADKDVEEVKDSFIKHAYLSWKGKYCVNIKFTE